MRAITEYERNKWFDKWNRFEIYPEFEGFLMYGDELGEAFDNVARATHMRDYGLPDAYVEHATIVALDMYYDQLYWYYVEAQDEIEEVGLPSPELIIEKAKEAGIKKIAYYGEPRTDEERKLWDWALEWRDEHIEELLDRRRAEWSKIFTPSPIERGEEDGS